MIEVWGSYYEDPGAGYKPKRVRGHIYEALIPYSNEPMPQQLRVVATEEGQPPWCEVEVSGLDQIRGSTGVPELGLRSRETMLVRRAKCRRVVLLSAPPIKWQSGRRGSDPVYLVAPIYSFKSDDEPDFRSRVKAYAYNTLFWIPADRDTGMYEGLVRLDRVQPVHSSLLDAKPVKLTARALDGLIAWYGSYLRDMVPDKIRAYRDTALAQLPKS